MAEPTYLLHKDAAGFYLFSLRSPDGHVLLTSTGYKTPGIAVASIQSLRLNALKDAAYERLSSSRREPYFALRMSQGIATSAMFSTLAEREEAITFVKLHAPGAAVVEAP